VADGVAELRQLPSVDRLLSGPAALELIARYGRPFVLEAVRQTLDGARQAIRNGDEPPADGTLLTEVRSYLEAATAPTLRPAINATGVIIHTNLGRAPLSKSARAAVEAVARGYSTLEYDVEAGARGSRSVHAEALLCRITGAEAALVVNNNAGAVLLILTALAAGREVVISRGQLVEIGGGFRIPDVMRQSGARLVEVGTTNRTHLRDYEAAIGPETALLLRAHHSNFKIVGFASEPSLGELAELVSRHNLPLVDDLGSGALLDTAAYGLEHEPMAQESLAAGAALVAFSGDKLLGGPQAGIIAGRRDLVDALKRHPLARALRADKLCLAALQATLVHYVKDEAVREVPVWQMIAAPLDKIEARARRWAERLSRVGLHAEVIPGESAVGGGSLPGATLPTRLVALTVASPDDLMARLHAADPPVIARIEADQLVLDPRTVLPEDEEPLLRAIEAA
jgi:L-seryl-tRNA(Ser) seleniumtransferase